MIILYDEVLFGQNEAMINGKPQSILDNFNYKFYDKYILFSF